MASQRVSALKALGHNLKSVNLLPVKQMRIAFDPFHKDVRSCRQFLFQMSVPKIRQTNLNFNLKCDVRSDHTEPIVEVLFNDGHKAVMKTTNLSTLELVKEFNKLCDARSQSDKK